MSSVHWSPQFCTSYDRIATCGGDGRLQVHRLDRQGLSTEAWADDIQTVQVRDDKVCVHVHMLLRLPCSLWVVVWRPRGWWVCKRERAGGCLFSALGVHMRFGVLGKLKVLRKACIM